MSATTAYFVTNNAYDSIVIPSTHQYFQVGEQGRGKELADFLADDPGSFDLDWSGHEMDEDEDAEDYGTIIAERADSGPVIVHDEEAWAERLAFHGLTA